MLKFDDKNNIEFKFSDRFKVKVPKPSGGSDPKVSIGPVGIGPGTVGLSTPKFTYYESKLFEGGIKFESGVRLFEPLLRFADDFRVQTLETYLPFMLEDQLQAISIEQNRVSEMINAYKKIDPVININFKPDWEG